MPAGLQVFNNFGTIQITDEYVNFSLLAQGNINLGSARSGSITGWTWFSGPMVDIYVPNTLGYPPVLAFHSTGTVVIFDAKLDGANWKYTIMGEYGTAAGLYVEWFAFGPTPNVSPDNYGLQVFRADGSLAFHSSYKPMRVVALMEGYDAPGSVSLPSGRKYAGACSSRFGYTTAMFPAGTWTAYQHDSGIKCRSDGADVTTPKVLEYRAAAPVVPTEIRYYGWKYLVFDVTGF